MIDALTGNLEKKKEGSRGGQGASSCSRVCGPDNLGPSTWCTIWFTLGSMPGPGGRTSLKRRSGDRSGCDPRFLHGEAS
jgi:hypothetical protein